MKLKVQVEEIGVQQQQLVSSEVNLVLNKDCVWVILDGGALLGSVLEMMI